MDPRADPRLIWLLTPVPRFLRAAIRFLGTMHLFRELTYLTRRAEKQARCAAHHARAVHQGVRRHAPLDKR
jgi:hypothetical protein